MTHEDIQRALWKAGVSPADQLRVWRELAMIRAFGEQVEASGVKTSAN